MIVEYYMRLDDDSAILKKVDNIFGHFKKLKGFIIYISLFIDFHIYSFAL